MKIAHFIAALVSAILIAQSARADLFNVDFKSGQPGVELGFAATGQTANDFWNSYTNRNPDGSFKADGSLENLKNAAGVASSVGLAVQNGAGGWNVSTSDVMYNSYIYPLSSGNLVITITNLPAGVYNFYLYSIDSRFNLKVDGTDFGTNATYNNPIASPPPWVSGEHYVLVSDVVIGAAQPMVIVNVSPGQQNPAVISGMQIESASSCSPHTAAARAVVVNGFVVGATITDGGCGYTNSAPTVRILGGGGSGATATAIVTNGFVTGINITDAGIGYTGTPTILIDSPPLGLQTSLMKAVRPFLTGLHLGTNYLLQVSTDMKSWTNSGSRFTATNTSMVYPLYFDVDNFNQLFFRLQAAP